MRFWEIDIAATSQGIEVLTGLLEELGVSGMVVSDPRDFEDFLNKTQTYWDYVDDALVREKQGLSRVTFYVENSPAGYGMIAAVRGAGMKERHAHRVPPRRTQA